MRLQLRSSINSLLLELKKSAGRLVSNDLNDGTWLQDRVTNRVRRKYSRFSSELRAVLLEVTSSADLSGKVTWRQSDSPSPPDIVPDCFI